VPGVDAVWRRTVLISPAENPSCPRMGKTRIATAIQCKKTSGDKGAARQEIFDKQKGRRGKAAPRNQGRQTCLGRGEGDRGERGKARE